MGNFNKFEIIWCHGWSTSPHHQLSRCLYWDVFWFPMNIRVWVSVGSVQKTLFQEFYGQFRCNFFKLQLWTLCSLGLRWRQSPLSWMISIYERFIHCWRMSSKEIRIGLLALPIDGQQQFVTGGFLPMLPCSTHLNSSNVKLHWSL